MVTNTRGWSVARQTKVMDSYPSPLKKGRQGNTTSSYDNVASSKPASVGRDTTEATQDTDTVASRCGKKIQNL